MGKRYRIIVLLLFLVPVCSWAQTMDCEQTIAHATDEYNAGHFYSVPGILHDCLKSLSREQKQRAYLLLTQTYLLLDDPIGAQRSFLEILEANPEFVADEQLHAIDIVYLSKRFTATPKFSWFVGAGSNVSPVRVILDPDIGADAGEKYNLRPGYSLGVGGEFSYDDNLRLRAEVNFLHTSYRAQAIGQYGSDTKTLIDNQTWINVPVYVCYSDNVGTYRPYGYVGASISNLLIDRGSITLRNVDGEGDAMEIFEVQSANYNFTERRNRFNQSIIFGGGIKYKIGLDFVFAELRYSVGLRNVVNPDYIYGNHTLDQTSVEWVASTNAATEYGHVDDYFRLDNVAITFGFIRPLYKPRELKRARTKSVLRKMKRSR